MLPGNIEQSVGGAAGDVSANCVSCGAPSREAICVNRGTDFEPLEGDWFTELVRCRKCEALWQCINYEPFASFPHLVPWHLTVGQWIDFFKIDEGYRLGVWQEALLVDAWERLAEADKHRARQHYERAPEAAPYYRIFATDAMWEGYVYYHKMYVWSMRLSAEEMRLLENRRMPIPDLEYLARTHKLSP